MIINGNTARVQRFIEMQYIDKTKIKRLPKLDMKHDIEGKHVADIARLDAHISKQFYLKSKKILSASYKF